MNRTGEKNYNSFGSKIIISKYRKNNDIDVYFPEYNWTKYNSEYKEFKNGTIRCPYEPRIFGIGYIGEGPYKTREGKEQTKIYKTWHAMIRRCYDKELHKKYPTYKDCEVCKEWHNFQEFAKWYNNNYYEIDNERMALDKDILIKGNKIYSPDTCVFVPQSINTLFIKHNADRGNLPIGVHYDKQHKKYRAQCRIKNSNQKTLGLYNTPEKAFLAYKKFKEQYVKQVADEYINLIPRSLYSAMINYKVEKKD